MKNSKIKSLIKVIEEKRWVRNYLIAILSADAFLLCLYLSGIYINPTKSLPLGIYITTNKKMTSQNTPGTTILIQKDKLVGVEQNRAKKADYFIKKVLGVENDLVETTKDGNFVKINGKIIEKMRIYKKDKMGREIKRTMKYPCKIPKGFYFVGSNCEVGYDSRYWGLVPEDAIVKRVKLLYAF